MCCTWLAKNTGRKKSQLWHHRTTLSGYIFAAEACIDNHKKNLLNSNTSCTCPHNIANFGLLMAEIGSWFWGTPQIWTGFASCLHYCTDVAHRRPTKLHTMFGRLLDWYTRYTFSGPLARWWNFADSLYIQLLRSPILAALLHGTPAAGMSQALRCGTRNRIMERLQRAPPVFGWAAIKLGIRPHSSFCCLTRQYNTFTCNACIVNY